MPANGWRTGSRGLCLIGLLCFGDVGLTHAQADKVVPSEYQVKAAFIFKFATYVQWPTPAPAAKPFVIGILGDDPFGSDFEEIVRGQMVQTRPVVIARFRTIEEVTSCDILFISASERDDLRWILAQLREAPVLTIGDLDQFAERGGMIHLTSEGNRIRFNVNVAALKRARLKAASQLLRLATIVSDAPGSR